MRHSGDRNNPVAANDQVIEAPNLRIRLTNGRAVVHYTHTRGTLIVKGELQDYYQPVRRCGKLGEGKHTMLVLNAVASAIRS